MNKPEGISEAETLFRHMIVSTLSNGVENARLQKCNCELLAKKLLREQTKCGTRLLLVIFTPSLAKQRVTGEQA